MEIKKLKNTDSLSESMNTINTNFEILSRIDEGDKQRWEKYINGLDGKVKTLIDAIDSKNIELSEQIEHIGDMFNNVPNMDDLQHQVSIAISDVNSELGNAIKNISAGAAGIQVENKMGDYAKTTYVNNALSNYTTSVAFEDYKSDSKNKTASANSIVANSKFYTTDDGYFVLLTGTKSGYKNLGEYYDDLETADKSVIDPDGKGLSDPDVLNRFITHCEQKFKTVSTELAGFSAKVAEDMAELDILAQISNDGKQISAAIITQANSEGSEIKLNADHIYVGSNHDLDIESGGGLNIKSGGGLTINSGADLKINSGGKFEVSSSNFNIDSEGNVTISGAITATSLTIASNSSAASQFNSLVQSAGNGVWAALGDIPDKISELTNDTGFITDSALDGYTTTSALNNTLSTYVQTTTFGTTLENYATKSDLSNAEYNDNWLTSAFSKTTVSGGLVLTGNVVTMDASSNPTAGMMGGSNLRFFAGSSDLSSAPFRVYKDGSLYATNAHITGEITATSLTIGSSASSTFNSLVQNAVSSAGYVNNSVLSSILSTYVETTTFGTTLENYATKSDLSSVQTYDDSWVSKAFNKTLIQGGLAMTGNIFAADNSGNITAGMMGATTPGNDLRFFAGSDNTNASTAPFRIYENGALYASDAHITGLLSNKFLRITSSNWENYKYDLGEYNGQHAYTIDLNLTGSNVEIGYLPPVPSGVGLVFDVYTPTITEETVGTELNIINLIPKKSIIIGRNYLSDYSDPTSYTNAQIIHRDSSTTYGWAGGNVDGKVEFLECMRLRAIQLPEWNGSGVRFAWIRLDIPDSTT